MVDFTKTDINVAIKGVLNGLECVQLVVKHSKLLKIAQIQMNLNNNTKYQLIFRDKKTWISTTAEPRFYFIAFDIFLAIRSITGTVTLFPACL